MKRLAELVFLGTMLSACGISPEARDPCQGYWHRQAVTTFACERIENCRFGVVQLQDALREKELHPECFKREDLR